MSTSLAEQNGHTGWRQEFLEALQEREDFSLEIRGGYPALIDGETIRGWIVIASIDDQDAPDLQLIPWSEAKRWWRFAKDYKTENPDCDWTEALGETEVDIVCR